MTAEEALHVFDPFNNRPNHQKLLNPLGVGVGLSICKQICESLGGDIKLFTKLNSGSNFVFTMAVYESAHMLA